MKRVPLTFVFNVVLQVKTKSRIWSSRGRESSQESRAERTTSGSEMMKIEENGKGGGLSKAKAKKRQSG